MLVNGNLGAGVAVAGAFGLVRFRSAPGHSEGFVPRDGHRPCDRHGAMWLAVVAFVIVSAVMLLLTAVNFGGADDKRAQDHDPRKS